MQQSCVSSIEPESALDIQLEQPRFAQGFEVFGSGRRSERRKRSQLAGTARFDATDRDESSPIGVRERAQGFAKRIVVKRIVADSVSLE